MERIRVRGGRRLEGSIRISGAKNSALPLMAASLLTSDALTLSNVPNLADIATLASLLGQHGVGIDVRQNGDANDGGQTLRMCAAKVESTTAPYDLVRKMRASVLVLGPLLARCHQAKVSLPGGCAIGTRPVDLHLKALEQLGARIDLEEGYVHAEAPGGLRGGHVRFPTVSVGATENLMMAATLAEGESILENAAREYRRSWCGGTLRGQSSCHGRPNRNRHLYGCCCDYGRRVDTDRNKCGYAWGGY